MDMDVCVLLKLKSFCAPVHFEVDHWSSVGWLSMLNLLPASASQAVGHDFQ